jgi:hypothetical protein
MIKSGAKLNGEPDGAVGAGSVQFTAQHKSAAEACGVFSLMALQQGIVAILLSMLPECSGVPANTLPARTKSKNMDVSRFTIAKLNLLQTPNSRQVQRHIIKCERNEFLFRPLALFSSFSLND